jgi:hypothetical protein
MLRRFNPTLFLTVPSRAFRISISGVVKTDAAAKAKASEAKGNTFFTPDNALLLAAAIMSDDEFSTMMSRRIFKVSPDEMRQHIIHDRVLLTAVVLHVGDFDLLVEKFSKEQRAELAQVLCHDIVSLQAFLRPLPEHTQRRVMDFVGLKGLTALGEHLKITAAESDDCKFFLLSEAINSALKRNNLGYLYMMKEREEKVEIAAEDNQAKLKM